MPDSLILDYRVEHDGQQCRLIVFRSGVAELRRGTALRRGRLTWVELRELDAALLAAGFDQLPRFHDGGAIGGVHCSLSYGDDDVRVVRCLTRELWRHFPMMQALEDMVVRLNGWPEAAAVRRRPLSLRRRSMRRAR